MLDMVQHFKALTRNFQTRMIFRDPGEIIQYVKLYLCFIIVFQLSFAIIFNDDNYS